MNKARRKTINGLIAQAGAIADEIDALHDEEQEAFDALPESVQGSDRGQASEAAATALEDAAEAIREAIGQLEQAAE